MGPKNSGGYTRARQVKLPGLKIYRPASRPGFALPIVYRSCTSTVVNGPECGGTESLGPENTGGCSDLEMTWLLCCAGAAIAYRLPETVRSLQCYSLSPLFTALHFAEEVEGSSVCLLCVLQRS